MVILFLLLVAVIYTIFLCIGAIAAALLESLIMYFPLIILCVLFNTAFIIQTVIAIISKIKKKKFGKGNIIRTIILGIITFVLFIVSIILIFLKNFQAWKELFSSWVSQLFPNIRPVRGCEATSKRQSQSDRSFRTGLIIKLWMKLKK